MKLVTIALLIALCCVKALAQIQVSPQSVNAYSQGATSVLLTFGGLANQQPREAAWCGRVISAAPNLGMQCEPGTIFGRLPARYNQATLSANNSYTDVMSITPQIARQAYLDAVRGDTSTFFYVRRFVSTGGGLDEFVPVTIRLTGDGAGVPLSLTEVKLTWGIGKPVLFVKTGERLPRFEAEIHYTGTGRLKGRWELVKPGEASPEPRDLLTEATLPIEDRSLQKRYTQMSRFNIYLPPTGKVTLPGPETWRVDESLNGLYVVLLRIEASDDGEGDTNLAAVGAGPGVVPGGAVAGFSLPTLKYYVSNGTTPSPQFIATAGDLLLLEPVEQALVKTDQPIEFGWTTIQSAVTYRIEVEDLQGGPILSAILLQGASSYRAPPWFKDKVGNTVIRWRVSAFDHQQKLIVNTEWRAFRLSPPATGRL